MIDKLSRVLSVLSKQSRFIKENLEGTIDLGRKKREEVNKILNTKNDMIDEDENFKYLLIECNG